MRTMGRAKGPLYEVLQKVRRAERASRRFEKVHLAEDCKMRYTSRLSRQTVRACELHREYCCCLASLSVSCIKIVLPGRYCLGKHDGRLAAARTFTRVRKSIFTDSLLPQVQLYAAQRQTDNTSFSDPFSPSKTSRARSEV